MESAALNGAGSTKAVRPERLKPRVALDPVLTDLRGVMEMVGASANGVDALVKSGVLPPPLHLGGNRRMRRWNVAEVRARLEGLTSAGVQPAPARDQITS